MEIQLLLTGFIIVISSGSISLKESSDNEVKDQAVMSQINGESKLQENLQNLFDSIGKSDPERRETYRKLLKQEVARQQKAFDAVLEEIWKARRKKSDSKRNLYIYVDSNGNKKVVKRFQTFTYEYQGPDSAELEAIRANATPSGPSCKTTSRHQNLEAGKYLMLPSDCSIFYCHNGTEITKPVLYIIPCKDYVAKKFPVQFPEHGKEFFRVLCKTCMQDILHQYYQA